jgi:hypothetical protein
MVNEMLTSKAAKKRVVIPPRSPLPNRIKRVVNPGMPDAKRARRTTAEVTAATKQKHVLRQEIEQLEQKKIWIAAQIEMQEEAEDTDESCESNMVNEKSKRMEEDTPSEAQNEDMVEEDANRSSDMADAGKKAPIVRSHLKQARVDTAPH